MDHVEKAALSQTRLVVASAAWEASSFELREPWQGAVSIMSTRWRRTPHPVGKGPKSVSERNLADSWKPKKGKPDCFGLYFSAFHIYI